MIRRLAIAACILTSPLLNTPAESEVLIAPTRIVLERGERSAELVIVNKGDEEAAFRVSIENRRMLENGSLELAEDKQDGELFAIDHVRYAPRRVILEPGGKQTIRVSANLASGLEPGEYRSHLRLMSVPTSAGRSLPAATDTEENALSIQLIAIRSLTIPIILRVGELNAEVQITDLRIDDKQRQSDNGEEHLLVARFAREGSRSTYGDVQIFLDGQREPVYFARGVAVYTPNNERDVILPLPNDVHDQLQGQPVRIAYVSSDPDNQQTYAELRTVLN
ncbi:MAG: hypothetical protein AAFV54_08150 [Pseudomonadota bacterium]